ncbi:SsgA family sporulation/cell division regulator [Streptomyces sp. NPDC004100]
MDVFIEDVCEMRLVAAPGLDIPVPTRLSYSPYDPYAVHFTFAAGTASAATWVFARELLALGVREPCGEGDVRIRPGRSPDGDIVSIALSAPGQEALFEGPLEDVRSWLARICEEVPPGRESKFLDLEDELCDLLEEVG